mgnify:CR=1 FL=1|tara:strand:- start:71314 stop:72681 length:1368 start_codon:yes stop_codon:yes gene_type:complete
MKSDNKKHIILRENFPFFTFLLVSFAVVFGLASSNFFVSGDTVVLMNSIKTISDCLENGNFTICPSVAHFPLSQHLIGYLFYKSGIPIENLLGSFKILNLFAWFFGLLIPAFFWRNKKHLPALLIYFIVYISSPLWWYGNTSFNEILSATLISLFLLSLMYTSYLPFLTSFFVVLTKEVAFLYVVAWSIAIAVIKFKEDKGNAKRTVLSALAGTTLGLTFQVLFNFWRFNSPINNELLLPIYRVPTFEVKLNFFLAQWFGPNVGILYFWPALTVLFVMYFRFHKTWKWYFSRLTVGLFLLSVTIGFALWCAPFGWVAYGHRLIVPWLPGLTLFLLYSGNDTISKSLNEIASSPFLKYFVSLAVTALTMPNIAILFNINNISNFFVPDSVCPTPAILQTDANYYYKCIQHYAWDANWIHSVTFSHTDWPKAGLAIAIGLISLVALFYKLLKATRET